MLHCMRQEATHYGPTRIVYEKHQNLFAPAYERFPGSRGWDPGLHRSDDCEMTLGYLPILLAGDMPNHRNYRLTVIRTGNSIKERDLVGTLFIAATRNLTESPTSRITTNLTPFTTRPLSTSRQGVIRLTRPIDAIDLCLLLLCLGCIS